MLFLCSLVDQSSAFIFLLRAHGIKSTLAHSQALKCEPTAEAAGKTSGGGAPVAGWGWGGAAVAYILLPWNNSEKQIVLLTFYNFNQFPGSYFFPIWNASITTTLGTMKSSPLPVPQSTGGGRTAWQGSASGTDESLFQGKWQRQGREEDAAALVSCAGMEHTSAENAFVCFCENVSLRKACTLCRHRSSTRGARGGRSETGEGLLRGKPRVLSPFLFSFYWWPYCRCPSPLLCPPSEVF